VFSATLGDDVETEARLFMKSLTVVNRSGHTVSLLMHRPTMCVVIRHGWFALSGQLYPENTT